MPDVEIYGTVRLARAIEPDLLEVLGRGIAGPPLEPGEHPFTMNGGGAVSAVRPDGRGFGLRPNEFEFVAITRPLSKRQLGAWLMQGVDIGEYLTGDAEPRGSWLAKAAMTLLLGLSAKVGSSPSFPGVDAPRQSVLDWLVDLAERFQGALEEKDREIARLRQVIERDRTAYDSGITRILGEIASRRPMAEGRGPYEWDDDRYRREFAAALTAIHAHAKRATAESRALLWEDTPGTQAEVDAARAELARIRAGIVAEQDREILDYLDARATLSDREHPDRPRELLVVAFLPDVPAEEILALAKGGTVPLRALVRAAMEREQERSRAAQAEAPV